MEGRFTELVVFVGRIYASVVIRGAFGALSSLGFYP